LVAALLTSSAIFAPAIAFSAPAVPTPAILSFRAHEAETEVAPLIKSGRESELRLQGPAQNGPVETHKFQHYYKGLEVVGSMALHHYGRAGTQVQDRLFRFDVDTSPTLSSAEATSLAFSFIQAEPGEKPNLSGAPKLKILPATRGNSAQLVYWIEFAGDVLAPGETIVIDAHSGKLLARLPKHLSIAPIEVRSAAKQGNAIKILGDDQPFGCQITDLATGTSKTVGLFACRAALQGSACQSVLSDGRPSSVQPELCTTADEKSDEAARRARENSQAVLDYYSRVHGRDSYDGRGGKLVNLVHVGVAFANAFWSESTHFMSYGDGNAEQGMGDMTKALDVAGHEMTHGVTEQTAALLPMDESGALNEATSDFFGKMIEHSAHGLAAGRAAWVMGLDLVSDPSIFDGIRDLANPGALKAKRQKNGAVVMIPYPAKASEKFAVNEGEACDGRNDRCFVHFNSTIPGHASYLVHEAIGKDKAERIYYLALTQYYTAQATFETAADDVKKACAQLYDAATCDKVRQIYGDLGFN
jgi:Zn-dependent metalloprotease